MSEKSQFSINEIMIVVKVILIIIMLLIIIDQFIYLSVESNCYDFIMVSGKTISCGTNGSSKNLMFPTAYEFMAMALALIFLLVTDILKADKQIKIP